MERMEKRIIKNTIKTSIDTVKDICTDEEAKKIVIEQLEARLEEFK